MKILLKYIKLVLNIIIDFISTVHKLADDENDSSRLLFEHYTETLSKYMEEAYEIIKTEQNEKLIDAFLRENTQCNILIHWMRKVFVYLDKFYVKTNNIGTLHTNAMKIYERILFLQLKEKLFEAVNKMIEDDRDCKLVDRNKIKKMLKIIEEVDLKNPVLNKVEDNLFWTGEQTNGHLNEWFNKYLLPSTEKYVQSKATREVSTLNALEYVKSSLKYLDEEEARKSEYFNKAFHDRIDRVNFKYLIELNAKTIAKMDTGIRYMFINKKDSDLKESFRLISKFPESLKFMTDEMDPFIRERGDELYNNKDLAKDPVSK